MGGVVPPAAADATCAPPPTPLPTDITVTVAGREHTLGEFKHPELMPRKVHVYLPEGYSESTRYPVLYAYDGNLLAKPASDAIDKLIAAGKPVEPHIVVGIESSSQRIDELAPWVQQVPSPTFEVQVGQGGKGQALDALIVEVIKPYIEAHYAARCDRASTTVMGWSLGGLMCLYQVLTHPEVFGRGHCISGAYWWNGSQILDEWRNYAGPPPVRLWIDVGFAEPFDLMVAPAREVRDIALDHGWVLGDNLGYYEQAGGNHYSGPGRFPFSLWSLSDTSLRLVDSAATALELSVTTPSMTLLLGVTTSQTSVGRSYADGYSVTWPNEGIVFTSDNPNVATVDPGGRIRAMGVGSATITGVLEGFMGSVDVQVL